MNMKQKHGTAQNARSNIPNAMQLVQRPRSSARKNDRKNEEAREQELRREESMKIQDDAMLRTLQKYGQGSRGKTQPKRSVEKTNRENDDGGKTYKKSQYEM